jgi:uroporphyrinogen-III synthase
MPSYNILSTKILPPSIKKGAANDIDISEIELIQIKPIQTIEKSKEIIQWLKAPLPVIFTSANAIEIINQLLNQEHIEFGNRTIYSLSGKTYDRLKKYFPHHTITIANKASELAEMILYDHVDEIVFFCGDIRRNELPDTLQQNTARVHEVIIYQTIEIPTKIDGCWDAVLFFSPSGVRSFFAANKLPPETICFAIGETTATTISQYTQNKTMQSKTPDPGNMIKEVAAYFKNLSEHGIKE